MYAFFILRKKHCSIFVNIFYNKRCNYWSCGLFTAHRRCALNSVVSVIWDIDSFFTAFLSWLLLSLVPFTEDEAEIQVKQKAPLERSTSSNRSALSYLTRVTNKLYLISTIFHLVSISSSRTANNRCYCTGHQSHRCLWAAIEIFGTEQRKKIFWVHNTFL